MVPIERVRSHSLYPLRRPCPAPPPPLPAHSRPYLCYSALDHATLRFAFASVLPVSLTKKTTSWQLKAVVVRRNGADRAIPLPSVPDQCGYYLGGRTTLGAGAKAEEITSWESKDTRRSHEEVWSGFCAASKSWEAAYQVVLRNITLPRGSNVGTAEEAKKSVGAGELHTPGIRGSAADEPVCSEYHGVGHWTFVNEAPSAAATATVTKSWDQDRWIKTAGVSYCGGGGAFRAGADLFGHGTDGGCALLPPSLLVDEQVLLCQTECGGANATACVGFTIYPKTVQPSVAAQCCFRTGTVATKPPNAKSTALCYEKQRDERQLNTRSGVTTEVDDVYQWKEAGCVTEFVTASRFAQCVRDATSQTKTNMKTTTDETPQSNKWQPEASGGAHATDEGRGAAPRIALLGDSTLRNVYYDLVLSLRGDEALTEQYSLPYKYKYTYTPRDKKRTHKTRTAATATTATTRLEVSYFESYGYYPLQDTTNPARGCGEDDFVRRQKGRVGRLGFDAMKRALEFVRDSGLLVMRSPAVHEARSYVSEQEHAAIVERMVRTVREAGMDDRRVIWLGPTPLNEHHPMDLARAHATEGNIKKSWLDNRSERRARLAQVQERVFRRLRFRPRRIIVWDMAGTRSDRYFDDTHVYPAPW